MYNFKNAKHPRITKKQVICDGGPIGNMEGENRRMARWEASKKAFKRSKSMFRCDEKASKGASSVGDIMCDFGSPKLVCKVTRLSHDVEKNPGPSSQCHGVR